RLLPRLPARGHVLDPVLDPLHRPADELRGGADDEVLAAETGLLAEGAADVGDQDADALRRMAEEACERLAEAVRRLRASVIRQVARARPEVRDAAAALH